MTTILFYDEGAQGTTQLGGGQYQALSVMERLSAEFDPVLLTSTDGELAAAARRRGVPVRVCDVTRHLDRRTRRDVSTGIRAGLTLGAGLPQAVRKLRQQVRAVDPDIVHPNENLARLTTALACWRSDRATVTYVDGLWNQTVVDPLMRATFAHSFDRLVAVSESVAAVFGADGDRPANVVTVYPGIELDRFTDVGTPAKPFPETTGDVVVTVVGSLKPVKGHEDLFEALARVNRQDVLCLVVGSGPRRAALEARAVDLNIADRVEFLGQRSDVPAILAETDVAVVPSRAEALGRVALEAMAAGVPVVASDVGGLGEVVVDGETGILVPPGDPPALAGALRELVDDAQRRRRLGSNAQTRVVDRFAFERGVRALEAVYRSVRA